MSDSVVSKPDGSLNFSGGVDSIAVTTIQSELNPTGLRRDQLAWLINATVRDGGITQRWGWKLKGRAHAGDAIFQGAIIYEPLAANPYLVLSVGGHILTFDPDTGIVQDLSVAFALLNPSGLDYSYFCQAEEFLIIQAGDGTTLPLFWDGTTLRRSKGITWDAVPPGSPGINEIPAAFAMEYFMGRLWYAQGRQYSAGDIVGGPSGTVPYNRRDAVLNVTENPLVLGGDGFTVPTNAGNIRALKSGAQIDATQGQGRLFIFTNKAVYALQVPVSRADWVAAGNEYSGTSKTGMPLQTVVQLVNGSVNDRTVSAVNGDLFYQSFEPGIRSLFQAIRYFNQWGNKQLSANENRVLQFNDRALMRFGSGITFDNRILQTALPTQTTFGVISKCIVPMDFIPISTFGQDRQPNWEGIWQGLNVLQLVSGVFGSRERAFAIVLSENDVGFDVWELTVGERFEESDKRVQWQIEFPALTWGKEFDMKKTVTAEVWYDRLVGTVDFTLQWRPDGETCWHTWHQWQTCAPRTSEESVEDPIAYPILPCGPGFRQTIKLPKPPHVASTSGRPAYVGYQMQARLTIKGYCRIRGMLLYAEPFLTKFYDSMVT